MRFLQPPSPVGVLPLRHDSDGLGHPLVGREAVALRERLLWDGSWELAEAHRPPTAGGPGRYETARRR